MSIRLVNSNLNKVFNTTKHIQITLTLNKAQRRYKHELIPISQDLKESCPLYPKTSMKFIEQEMEFHTEKLNDVVAGTKFEHETLFRTFNLAASDHYASVVFNHSSQLWNTAFFVQSLSTSQTPIKADLKKRLIEAFGSLQGFQTQFIAAAEAIFGNGWVWLIEDANGKLKIVNTLNSGNPLIPSRLQSFEGIESEEVSALVGNLSIPWTLPTDKPKGTYIPILNLNMWQTAYVPDYGIDIKQYVNTFLNQVDWNVVHNRLFRERF